MTEAEVVGLMKRLPPSLMCNWAPVEHDAEAEYRVEFTRPCLHSDVSDALSCEACTVRVRAMREAETPTACMDCGVVSRLVVARVSSLR